MKSAKKMLMIPGLMILILSILSTYSGYPAFCESEVITIDIAKDENKDWLLE
jgi:hypothetical protein